MPTNSQARVKMTATTPGSSSTNGDVVFSPSLRQNAVSNQLATVPLRASFTYSEKQLDDGKMSSFVSLAAIDRAKPGLVYKFVKRTFDVSVGLILLILAIPIILVAALAIRIDTPGSPFFFQTRLGKDGKPFRIFKLRGMFIDARVRYPTYYDYSKRRDLEFCFHHEDDPRVTRAGRFIRKTSIDELPNLWNVVTGDLSLVGPRPEIPEVLALYGPYRDEYLSIKPGVTCLSKCTGRDRLTKRETIEFDLEYIRNRCFTYDCQILWRTFRSVVLRRDVF